MEQNKNNTNTNITAEERKLSKIYIKRLVSDVKIPVKRDAYTVGYDIFAPFDIVIPASSRKVVQLGFAVSIPIGLDVTIEPVKDLQHEKERINTITKKKKRFLGIEYCTENIVSRCEELSVDILPTLIEPGDHEEVKLTIYNWGDEIIIPKGTRMAQMIVHHTLIVNIKETNQLTGFDRYEIK